MNFRVNARTKVYSNFTLNPTGRDWISKSGVTKLGLREGHDILDSSFTSVSTTSSKYNYLYLRSSEYSGVYYDPYLEVTYIQTNTDSNSTLSNIVNYTYGSGMQRIKKSSDESTTYYPSADYSVKDGVSTVYVSGPSGLVASVENGNTNTILTDHLGSTSVVTNKDGTMIELVDYNPYGTERINWSSSQSGKSNTQKTYIGQEYDANTGLNYLNARHYNSAVGKFISQDPVFLSPDSYGRDIFNAFLIDPQAQNSYSYAKNNPVTLSDPDGKFVPVIMGAISVLAMYAPQITSFAQSLLTPLGQVAVIQTIQDAQNGNYGMAVIGALTAGEIPAGKTGPIAKGLWSEGREANSVKNALVHFEKHGDEFGAQNAKQYVEKAHDFFNKPPEGTLIGSSIKNNGSTLFYHQESNTLGVLDKEGLPQSLYKPIEGIKYFQSQVKEFISGNNLKK